jgi:hypothetical protein
MICPISDNSFSHKNLQYLSLIHIKKWKCGKQEQGKLFVTVLTKRKTIKFFGDFVDTQRVISQLSYSYSQEIPS